MQSKRQSGVTHDNGSHLRSIFKNVTYRNWQSLLSMAAKCSAFEIKLTFGLLVHEIINVSGSREACSWKTAHRVGGKPENWHHVLFH